jgi:hypothetical protein
MATFSNIFGAKMSNTSNNDFICVNCDYKCSKKFNWDRHILTAKHIKSTTVNKIATKNEQNEQKRVKYICENCDKEYNDRTGLWRHKTKGCCAKKNCKTKEESESESEEEKKHNNLLDKELLDKDSLIIELLKQNKELLEIVKNGTHNTTNNTTHTNSHNKAFNLNFFLNETCKDAMNIMDFVDSIKLQLNDLEKVGELGYVEGISNIIVKNLKELDVNKRPVHCTDKKRETMYIKDENKWEKDEEKKKLHKVVRKVACKNQNLIPKFKELHPDCGKYSSKFSDQYNKIIVESMGGTGDNEHEKEEKIIKNISKQVFIDKEPS